MTETYIRLAQPADLTTIMGIIEDARQTLKAAGSTQWQGEYPNQSTINDDLTAHHAWVLVHQEQVVGYAAMVIGPDPSYEKIDGSWKINDQPYVAIHRIAVAKSHQGKHLVTPFMQLLIQESLNEGILDYRIDTGLNNVVMQHLITKLGFQQRGYVKVPTDLIEPRRVAYELNH